MPDKPYYAHIAQDQRVQTVMEHLSGAAEHAGECLANVGLGQAASLAGLLHDLGKCTEAFQQYLRDGDRSKRGSVIHTFQGCRYLLEGIPSDRDAVVKAYTSELLAFAIGAHHGLFDCVDAAGNSGLRYREEKESTFYAESVEGFLPRASRRPRSTKPLILPSARSRHGWTTSTPAMNGATNTVMRSVCLPDCCFRPSLTATGSIPRPLWGSPLCLYTPTSGLSGGIVLLLWSGSWQRSRRIPL